MVTLKRLIHLGPLVAAGIVGCAPLQQAPLVYSSKVSVGIDVSATATEQPGISINVGYKQIDAAYVPVAVAKPCDEKETGKRVNCTHNTYDLMKIEGGNKVGDSAVPKAALEAAQKRIADFKQIIQAKESAEAELTKAKLRRDVAQKELQAFETDQKNALKTARENKEVGWTNEEKILLAEHQKRTLLVDFEKAALTEAEGQKKKADEALDRANAAGLVEAFGLVGAENNKTDAYSVFGSFDANTKASAEVGASSSPKGGVALVIGKVFSTGVASQNLTEGMRDYYTGIGVAQAGKGRASCLSTGENYIAEYKKILNLDDAVDKKKLGAMIDRITETCSKGLADIDAKIVDQWKAAKK